MEFRQFEQDDPKSNRRCCYISKLRSGKPVFMKHGPRYFPIIIRIIRDHNPQMIVELGTHRGGMTLLLHEEFLDVEIHTFDQKALIDLGLFDHKKVFFYKEEIIKNESLVLIKLLEDNFDKRKLLYCDNGNKEKEIESYSKYLSPGDLLGCHDWMSEVKPENINPILEKLNFVPIPENKILKEKDLFSRFWIKES